jgi:hypothetical protein
MAAAVFKVQQLVGVVLYEQGKLFCQRHRLGKITDSVFDGWFFLFGAHGRLLSKDKVRWFNGDIFKDYNYAQYVANYRQTDVFRPLLVFWCYLTQPNSKETIGHAQEVSGAMQWRRLRLFISV